MHFNASKYKEQFPIKDNILENYIDNVYVTNDNDSFLEGYSKLWPNRSNMFGYLRVFRNLNNLHFPEHDDTLGECVPNDGQWLITMEEKGKWLYIPRTVYLARNHGDSENHRNWNIRGDTKLIEQANVPNGTSITLINLPNDFKIQQTMALFLLLSNTMVEFI